MNEGHRIYPFTSVSNTTTFDLIVLEVIPACMWQMQCTNMIFLKVAVIEKDRWVKHVLIKVVYVLNCLYIVSIYI